MQKLFRIDADLNVQQPQNRFKVLMNLQQLHLNGYFVTMDKLAVVLVEGGETRVRRFEKLLMDRVKWTRPGESEVIGKASLVWEGKGQVCKALRTVYEVDEKAGQQVFEEADLSHLWKAAMTYDSERLVHDV